MEVQAQQLDNYVCELSAQPFVQVGSMCGCGFHGSVMTVFCGFPVRFAHTELCGESDITTGSQLQYLLTSQVWQERETKKYKINK